MKVTGDLCREPESTLVTMRPSDVRRTEGWPGMIVPCSEEKMLSVSVRRARIGGLVEASGVRVAERSDVSVGAHQGVVGVDVLHVLHDTEGRVAVDPILLVHPRAHLRVHVPDSAVVTLSAAVEVLARILGDPKGLADLVVEVLEVLLEVVDVDIVVVDWGEVGAAIPVGVALLNTGLVEALDPLHSVGSRRGGGTTELDALVVTQRKELLNPNPDGVLGRDARLFVVVGLVEEESVGDGGTTEVVVDLLVPCSVVDLALAPEHRNKLQARLVSGLDVKRRPGVVPRGLGSNVVGDVLRVVLAPVVTVGPSDTELGAGILPASSGAANRARTRLGRRGRSLRGRLSGSRLLRLLLLLLALVLLLLLVLALLLLALVLLLLALVLLLLLLLLGRRRRGRLREGRSGRRGADLALASVRERRDLRSITLHLGAARKAVVVALDMLDVTSMGGAALDTTLVLGGNLCMVRDGVRIWW